MDGRTSTKTNVYLYCNQCIDGRRKRAARERGDASFCILHWTSIDFVDVYRVDILLSAMDLFTHQLPHLLRSAMLPIILSLSFYDAL